MAETISHKESMNKAIVDKVESVLSNADYIQSINISIKGEVGEVPIIDYRITECIVPGKEVENE